MLCSATYSKHKDRLHVTYALAAPLLRRPPGWISSSGSPSASLHGGSLTGSTSCAGRTFLTYFLFGFPFSCCKVFETPSSSAGRSPSAAVAFLAGVFLAGVFLAGVLFIGVFLALTAFLGVSSEIFSSDSSGALSLASISPSAACSVASVAFPLLAGVLFEAALPLPLPPELFLCSFCWALRSLVASSVS